MDEKRENTPSSSTGDDSSTDLPLLLDCLRYQQGCPSSQRQALTTMAAMCTRSASSRDHFRTSEALSFILGLLFPNPTQPSPSPQLQQAALYTLGCAAEKNLLNQMKLCEGRVFSLLSSIFGTLSSPPPLKTSAAYLAGCLMYNNAQGQNLSREGKVLHGLITLFKSHLPRQPQCPQEEQDVASSGCSFQLWRSVCSALCTATNNPQNESNQNLCCKVLPAALSVLQAPPTQPNTTRPAITVIASCVANNAMAQDRLGMVGGLEALIRALRDVIRPPTVHTPSPSSLHTAEMTELCLHIVKTLSAAALGHPSNCSQLSSLGATPLLLTLLRGVGLDSSARLTIIMCLGLLAEENTKSKCEIIEGGGLPLLLRSMADSKEEGLCKAATFVMQCCLQENNPKGVNPSFSTEDHNISSSIARLEKTLQLKQTAVADSPSSSHKATSSIGLNQELLRSLDSRKLPVNDRVSQWLDQANEPTSTSNHDNPLVVKNNVKLLEKLQYLQLLQNMTHENSELHTHIHPPPLLNATIPISAFTADPTQLQPQNLKAAYFAAKCNETSHCTTSKEYQEDEKEQLERLTDKTKKANYKVKEVTVQVSEKSVLNEVLQNGNMLQMTGDNQQQTEGSSEPKDKLNESEQHGDKCTAKSPEKHQEYISGEVKEHENMTMMQQRQTAAMEQELVRERATRERLERELAKERRKIKQLESQSRGDRHACLTIGRRQSELEQKPSHSQFQSISQSQFQPQTPPSKGSEVTKPLQNASAKHVPMSKLTSGTHSSETIPRKHYKEESTARTPKSTRSNVRYSSSVFRASKLPKRNGPSRVPNTCGNSLKLASHVARHRIGKSQESKPAKASPSHQFVASTQQFSYSKIVSAQTCPNPSIATSRAALKPLASIGCDHQCLGCKPRLKCPLITSRNFIRLLRADKFTCAHHRRLVHMICSHRNKFTHTSIKQQRGHKESGIDGKDVSEASHGSHSSTKEGFTNNTICSQMTALVQLPLHSESCHQPHTPIDSSESTELHPAGCTTTLPQSVTHSDERDSNEVDPCNGGTEDSSSQYCSDDSEEYKPTVTSTYMASARSEPHPPPARSSNPRARRLPHSTATTTCNQWTHSDGTLRSNPSPAPPNPIRASLARSSRLYSLKPKGVVLPVQAKTWSHGTGPKAVQPLRDVSNRTSSALLSVYDYHTAVKPASKCLPANTAKQAQPLSLPPSSPHQHPPTGTHRQRVPFTAAEEKWILEGVGKLGRRWRHILAAYPFHPRRTSVDLKDKYRRLAKKEMAG